MATRAVMTPCNIRIGGLHDIERHLLAGINIRIGTKPCLECNHSKFLYGGWVTCSPVKEAI